jgi:hypothetical protein
LIVSIALKWLFRPFCPNFVLYLPAREGQHRQDAHPGPQDFTGGVVADKAIRGLREPDIEDFIAITASVLPLDHFRTADFQG